MTASTVTVPCPTVPRRCICISRVAPLPRGVCWPGINTIAADLSLSRSTVKRALADLEKHGYLERESRYRDNGSHTSNLYRIK